ncbi:ABC transporter permease [Inconstantimicrobium mannanitabidum]|uniref:Peptide ABC transporter permease n=1 Tax=Inconstantimicrobium mannanitabidum TaxID=1604901 RepID=A0ACB5RE94_9CLOT|nr:ABC transporter permease [Clostridium sp. TW13]GKX67084.1 peptide ABC transporter permease [Clostridium sp. TW13]
MLKLTKEMMEPVDAEQLNADLVVRPNISYWQDAWRRLKKNPMAMCALGVLIIIIILAIVGPSIKGLDYVSINSSQKNIKPNGQYWFGTDNFGRDLFSRIWIGARISIAIALSATAIKVVIGSLYGAAMAYFGGFVDQLLMRIIEIISSIPDLILTMLIMIVLGNGKVSLLIALCFTAWINTARMLRGQIMQLRECEYVLAAEALGASPARIITKHLIPNTIGLLILDIATAIPGIIFAESSLSFLGIGLQTPDFSLGSLLASGQSAMAFYPYQLVCPSIVLCLIVLSFNLFGDGLRDALDPKLRQ